MRDINPRLAWIANNGKFDRYFEKAKHLPWWTAPDAMYLTVWIIYAELVIQAKIDGAVVTPPNFGNHSLKTWHLCRDGKFARSMQTFHNGGGVSVAIPPAQAQAKFTNRSSLVH